MIKPTYMLDSFMFVTIYTQTLISANISGAIVRFHHLGRLIPSVAKLEYKEEVLPSRHRWSLNRLPVINLISLDTLFEQKKHLFHVLSNQCKDDPLWNLFVEKNRRKLVVERINYDTYLMRGRSTMDQE